MARLDGRPQRRPLAKRFCCVKGGRGLVAEAARPPNRLVGDVAALCLKYVLGSGMVGFALRRSAGRPSSATASYGKVC
jgi:hypothetical protein